MKEQVYDLGNNSGLIVRDKKSHVGETINNNPNNIMFT
jgi:hypothetical protein